MASRKSVQPYLPFPDEDLAPREAPEYMQRYYRAEQPTRQLPSKPPAHLSPRARSKWLEARQQSVPGALRPWVRSSVQRRGFVQQKLPPTSQRGPWKRITKPNTAEAKDYASRVRDALRNSYVDSAAAELVHRNQDLVVEGFLQKKSPNAVAREIVSAEPYYSSRRLSRQREHRLSVGRERVRSRLWSHYSRNRVDALMSRYYNDIDQWIDDGMTAQEIANEIFAYEGSDDGEMYSQRGRKQPGEYHGKRIYRGELPTCDDYKDDPCTGWYETEDCAAYFVAGRNADWIPAPMYEGVPVAVKRYGVCLTNTQLARLMRGKKITGDQFGCGAFACVWPKGDRTIKFTHDPEDVAASLNARGIPHVKKFYKVFKLVDSGRIIDTGQPTPVWALIGEDVEPVDEYGDDVLRESIDHIPTGMLRERFDRWRYNGGRPENFKVPAEVHERFGNSCNYAFGASSDEAAECKRFGRQYLATWTKLARRGIVFMDAHSGNFGVDKQGRWKILDLGLSRSDIPEEFVEELHGIRRGIQRRARDKKAQRGWILAAAALGLILLAPKLR